MTAEQFDLVEQQGAVVALEGRVCLRLTGADRVRYLNGQVTNDVRGANDRETIYACITDAKGRALGDVFIHAAGDALWLDAEPELRESLAMRLERYIISDDAELADVSDEWSLWHIVGPTASTLVQGGEPRALSSTRLGCPGIDLWLGKGEPNPAPQLPLLSAEDFETLRILRGVPRWPYELNAETFPPEAGLDERAMSYSKGCYIGQEILSRIRSTGKMPRHLIRWESTGEIRAGDSLYAEEKLVGTVTSRATHPRSRLAIGLGMVKQGSVGPDSVLLAGAGAPSIDHRILVLPRVLP